MNNDNKNGCIICGKNLAYKDESEMLTCFYCGKQFAANVTCEDGHYVCDSCHASSANDLIETLCISTQLKSPLELAESIMSHPEVKMHGPEHHFLVPAVLLAAYYNITGQQDNKELAIKEARKRASKVPGGFCGTHGNCGAAVGAGIFISIIKGSTPLAGKEWQESNLMTARCLFTIGENGGPRCCKRNSFLAIEAVMSSFPDVFQKDKNVKCRFYKFNRECKGRECPYFK